MPGSANKADGGSAVVDGRLGKTTPVEADERLTVAVRSSRDLTLRYRDARGLRLGSEHTAALLTATLYLEPVDTLELLQQGRIRCLTQTIITCDPKLVRIIRILLMSYSRTYHMLISDGV